MAKADELSPVRLLPEPPVAVFGDDNDWLFLLGMLLAAWQEGIEAAYSRGWQTGVSKLPAIDELPESVRAAARQALARSALDDASRQMLQDHMRQASEQIAETFGARMQDVVAQASQDAESVQDILEEIHAEVERFVNSHAELVARTETVWAERAGEVSFYKAAGAVHLVWIHHPDACPFCLEMAGRVTDIEREFFALGETLTVEGATLNFDYSDIRHPPLHPACRCTLLARWE